MRKLLTIVPALAFALALGVANADEAKGKIKEVSKDGFSLADGTKFSIATGVSLEGLKAGSEVTVSYEMKDGKKVATKVSMAK